MMEKWYEKTMTKKSHMIILSLWLQDKDKSLVSTSISKKNGKSTLPKTNISPENKPS